MAHSHERFGNPDDLRGYLCKLDDPERDAWQMPDEVLRALELSPAMVAGEIGAGSGYFTFRLARAAALVYACDADVRLVEVLPGSASRPPPCAT